MHAAIFDRRALPTNHRRHHAITAIWQLQYLEIAETFAFTDEERN